MLRSIPIIAILLLSTLSLKAQGGINSAEGDETISYTYTPLDQTSNAKFGLHFFKDLNYVAPPSEVVSMSLSGAPIYSQNSGWGLVLKGDMRYNQHHKSAPPSNVSIAIAASLTGYYQIDIEGVNYIRNRDHKLLYSSTINSEPTRLYGLDYITSRGGTYGTYTERRYSAEIGYRYRAHQFLNLGINIDYLNTHATTLSTYTQEITKGLPLTYKGVGISLLTELSTHKHIDVNIERGIRLKIKGEVRPKSLGSSSRNLWSIEATLNYYQPLWHGALAALDVWGEHHSRHTPWMLRSHLGSDSRMRGYYQSRYNGNTQLGAQLELRQRVIRDLVVAGWGGVATIFSPRDKASWHKLLPNYGAGIRWHANSLTAIRIDIGFGLDGWGVVIGMNEAF